MPAARGERSGEHGQGGVVPSLAGRVGWLLLAGVAAVGVSVFVAGHVYGPTLALALLAGPALLMVAGLRVAWPLWLACVLTLLPVADLALWTGQIHVTESDGLICLAVALVALAMASRRQLMPAQEASMRFGPLQWLLVALMLASYGLSTDWSWLGRADFDPALMSGYTSPANGARLAKGFLLALLALPLLLAAFRARPGAAGDALALGMLGGLLSVSLAALWERLTFPGFSNFSMDYRTVALFWEMNVGGAQLDAWLAASLPFLIWGFARARSPVGLAFMTALAALAVYATFTTFSRGLYLGAVGGVALAALLQGQPALSRLGGRRLLVLGGGLALGTGLLGLLSGAVFLHGGYRGMVAVLGLICVVALGLWQLGGVGLGRALLGLVVGLVAAVATGVPALGVDKGIYVLYGCVATVACVALLAKGRCPPSAQGGLWAWAAVAWTACSAVAVNGYWGGFEALPAAIAAVAGLVFAALVASRFVARMPVPGARAVLALGGVLAALGVVGIAANAYFAKERMSTIAEDLDGRFVHWRQVVSLLVPGEQWLGIGTGRFAQRYALMAVDEAFPGGHALGRSEAGTMLRLVAPRHELGHGEIYRVTQRLAGAVIFPLRLTARVRAPGGSARLHAEVCARHLLYPFGCRSGTLPVRGVDWQDVSMTLGDVGRLGGGLAAMPVALSLGNVAKGSVLEIERLEVTDAAGRNLLRNAGFEDGGDFWLFSSDRLHLPWHAKNLLLHVWVEQGWLGAMAFGLLVLAALMRLVFGRAAGHALSPPLAGALVGLLTVGAFDSLIDAPRVAFLVFSLLWVSLGLRGGGRRSAMAQDG